MGVQRRGCHLPRRKGVPYYETRADLFREPRPQDAAYLLPFWEAPVRQLTEEEGPGILLYAPLGVGGHVDHKLVRRLGQRMLAAPSCAGHGTQE